MKKILFVLLSLFILVSNVNATSYVNSYYTITNKCSVINDNKVVIPVVIRAGHDKVKLSNLIKENRFGFVDNYKDALNLKVTSISSDNMEVFVDYNRDSKGRSLILFNVDDNLEFKNNEEIVSFNIEVNFINDSVFNKINILDNEVILSDAKTCESLNGFKITEVEKIKYVDLSKVDHKEYFEDLISKAIIVVLSIALIICVVLLIRKKK